MELPNGKARRNIAKKAGFLKKKQGASLFEWIEIVRRAQETGKQIHNHNTERDLRNRDAEIQKKEQELIEKFVNEGMSFDEAVNKLTTENGNMDSKGG